MIPINYPTVIEYTPRQRFFIERVLELLDPNVMDSYRTRVMNPKIILSELNYVLKRFDNNKIRHFAPTVESVKKEALNLLNLEDELKFDNFSKTHYVSILGQTTKDNYIKTRALTKVIISDNFRYNNDLANKIGAYISDLSTQSDDIYEDYKEIDRLTGYLLTGLIDKGFSKEFLLGVVLSSFINNTKETFEKAFGIFNFFSQKKKDKYYVYFKANLPKIENIIKNRNVKIYEGIPKLHINIKASENPRDFLKKDNKSFIRIKVEAHDSISAVTIARNEFYNLLDLIHLCFISEEIRVSDKNLIVELDYKDERQLRYWYGSFDSKLDGSFKGGSHIVEVLSKRLERIRGERSSIKYESRKKINSSIRYFRLSDEAQEIEHKFLNYWIGLEYLFSNTNDPQSTIERVKRYLPAIQANIYIKRLVKDFHKSIIRLKASSITGFLKEDISCLFQEAIYDEIWDEYQQKMPLLAYRARKFKGIFFSQPKPKKSNELIVLLLRHEEGLKQHLTRIYRLRNEIVHEAAVNIRTDIYTLTSNLKHYLLISLDMILEGLANNYGIDDINSFLMHQESIYENMQKENPDLQRIISLSGDTRLID